MVFILLVRIEFRTLTILNGGIRVSPTHDCTKDSSSFSLKHFLTTEKGL